MQSSWNGFDHFARRRRASRLAATRLVAAAAASTLLAACMGSKQAPEAAPWAAGEPGAASSGAAAGASAFSSASVPDTTIVDAREAFGKRDRARLAAARASAIAAGHPLAMWVDYWELNNRLGEAAQSELDAFYARWPGTYVEDRLRNDWLLELGRRQDWTNFAVEYPRFRMNDDREVTCYARLVDHLAGKDVAEAARNAWYGQRDPDTGCALMAGTLFAADALKNADVWHKARLAIDANRPRAAEQAVALLGADASKALGEALDSPVRFLTRKASARSRSQAEIAALALLRLAANDLEATVRLHEQRWSKALPPDLAAWVWASLGRRAAQDLRPEAPDHFQAAEERLARRPAREHDAGDTDWGDDTLAWKARAALRASAGVGPGITQGAGRWMQVRQAIDAMSDDARRDPAWIYWKARALLALAPPLPPDAAGAHPAATPPAPATAAAPVEPASAVARPPELRSESTGAERPAAAASASLETVADRAAPSAVPPAPVDPQRELGLELLRSIAGQMHFYGKLAAEDLGQPIVLPPRPLPPSEAERDAARENAGLTRALHLIAIGLRGEGVREWNFSIRGLGDRALLAAAQRACDREVWDRCINTSDRTREEIDLAQRFPTPFRNDVVARASEIGLDPAYVYGLIRQESRFIMDARSHVGASGLMQIMPATARWTARKTGMAFRNEMIADRDINLRLGTSYLKLVLDDFGGSQAMAAAGYNAGPRRPHRWREGPSLEVAAWTENIPFAETRDYVKKVLSNATYYDALLTGRDGPLSLKARLGRLVGPRAPDAPVPSTELP